MWRPALLILKDGKNRKYLFFESHYDAIDAGDAMSPGDWEIHSVPVFKPGELPEGVERPGKTARMFMRAEGE